VNNVLEFFFKNNDIVHETSCAGTPQNGIAERKNQHILKIARSLLFENNVPQIF
jgi:hypothetical protein